jgi:hypothetical protein
MMATSSIETLVDAKSRLLCYGVRCDRQLREELIASHAAEPGFIHGTVLVLHGQILVNTSVVDDSYSGHAGAFVIQMSEDGLVLTDGDVVIPVAFLRQPDYAWEPFKGATVGDYLRLHSPSTLFATPVRQCAYITANKPCTFCTFEGGRIVRLTPAEFGDLFDMYRQSHSGVKSVAFGGGSPNLRDFGAAYYTELAKTVKSRGDYETSVEIVPARKTADWLAVLKSGAVDAVISSIEIWDNGKRREICTGKSELSKEHYLERWGQVVEVLGAGSVSSVLLAGLEDLASTREGALTLIEHGVIPTIIPYRPYEDSPLGPIQPVPHADFALLGKEIRDALHQRGLAPQSQAGCTSCGACSLELNASVATAIKVTAD